jgi:hypothetical protein
VCCDGCTNAYHLPCLEDNFPQCTPGDDDDALWSCPRCTGTAPAAQPASSEASTVDWQQQPHTPPQVDGVVRLPHRKRQSAAAKEEPVVVSEYELDRQRNIERNLQRLQALGVHTSLQAMTEPLTKSGGNAKPEKVRTFVSVLRVCGVREGPLRSRAPGVSLIVANDGTI